MRSAGVWVASASAAPAATDGNAPNPDNDAVRPDAAENLVVDFGFYRMELGGTVFLDPTNNGLDGDDGDFASVTVLLYNGDGSAYLRADGSQASTVTDANGNYAFSGLPEGDYIVEIPASEFTEVLDGYANSDGNDPGAEPEQRRDRRGQRLPSVGRHLLRRRRASLRRSRSTSRDEPQDDQSPTRRLRGHDVQPHASTLASGTRRLASNSATRSGSTPTGTACTTMVSRRFPRVWWCSCSMLTPAPCSTPRPQTRPVSTCLRVWSRAGTS